MLTRRELQTLTRIGPAMPMGNLLRRFWQPFAYAWELEPGGPPLRIRLMGEDLVAYREARGRVGLVGAYCSHASAPLAYAENEGDGLRCMLHNWKFDATGRCVDLPGEVPGSHAALRSRIKGYRCVERDGIVFACLAAAEQAPAWPVYPWYELPPPQKCFDDLQVRTGAWLQLLEEELGEQMPATTDANHQPLAQEFLLPNCTLRGQERDGTHEARILVPIDEDHTLSWRVRWHPDRDLTEQPPQVELAPEQRRTHFARWWPATPTPAPSLDHLRPPEGPPPAEGDQTDDASESTLSLRSYRRLIEAARVLREQGTLPVRS